MFRFSVPANADGLTTLDGLLAEMVSGRFTVPFQVNIGAGAGGGPGGALEN